MSSEDRYRVLDLDPLICPTDTCTVVHPAGVIKFRDQHHLTQTFSRELGPHVGALVAAIIDDAILEDASPPSGADAQDDVEPDVPSGTAPQDSDSNI